MLRSMWSRVVVGRWPKRGPGERVLVVYLLPLIAIMLVTKASHDELLGPAIWIGVAVMFFVNAKTRDWV